MSFNRSGYIGRAPGDSAITISKQYFQPSGVTTDFTFSSGYDPGLIDVYRNGIKLINVLDYAATDGSTISLSTPVGVGSTVQVVAYKAYNVATVKATELDTTVTGTNVNLTGTLDVSSLGTFVDINVSGGATVGGTMVADSFSGDGTGLTGVASTDNIITGTAATFRDTAVNAGVPNVNIVGLATVGILTAYGTLSGTAAEFSAESTFSDVLNIGGIVNANATTDSTSSTTGALVVDGGLGVAKNVYIGAGLSVAGTLTYEDVTSVDSVGLITAKSGVNITGGELTVGSGITMGIAGVATFSGTADIHLRDNVKLLVGDSSDLEIYHQGFNSKIADVGTGALILSGSVVKIENGASSETQAVFTEDGAVDLYYNDTKKWETTNDGTVTTGIATATVGIDAAISVWTLGADGTSHYTFTGPGNLSATTDPTLNLKRGQKYTFKNRSGGHPFRIQSTPNGSAGTAYNTGVTNNDGGDGTNIIFDVPYNAPNVLYYQCTSHGNMGGAMYIDGSAYEISVGSGVTIGSAGVSTFSGTADVHLTDNVRLNVGDSSDLTIYHDGSTSNIVNTSGTINVGVNNFVVQRQGLDETMLYAQANTSVWLYYDNVVKLNTTKFGSITAGVHTATQGFITPGVCTATSFSGDGSNLTGISAGMSTSVSTAAGIVSTLALSDAQDHKVTVSGITTFTCNGGTEGDTHTLRIINSGITTIGFSTYFLFPSGSAPSIPTADGTVSLISFTVHRQGGSAGITTQLLAGASLNFS